MTDNWYTIDNIEVIDTPSLVLYADRVKENIAILKTFVHDITQVRPHVKTHKSAEVTKLLMDAGVIKFKCATIAEAEMLAIAGAKDILLAYQPVGPKVNRLVALVKKYSDSSFSCLIDSAASAKFIASIFDNAGHIINVFIDLNVGMNRTGITPEHAFQLVAECESLKGLNIVGLHAYDGHLRDQDLTIRTKQCDDAFAPVEVLRDAIEKHKGKTLTVVSGGTPTFPIHARRPNVECSPGTFIYWDKGYQSMLNEQPFLFAAIVVTRVISTPTADTICIDLGHKSIASENTIDKRVIFLNAPDVEPVGHSEEHMVLKVHNNNTYHVGDVLYGVPYHICPTVALYDRVQIVQNKNVNEQWVTLSRNRTITV